jgi:transcriptional regulator with XRE-family HTH domain
MVVKLSGGDVTAIRLASGMNQQQFSEHIGISQGLLSFVENGHRRVTPYFVMKLAQAVDVERPEIRDMLRRLSAVANF